MLQLMCVPCEVITATEAATDRQRQRTQTRTQAVAWKALSASIPSAPWGLLQDLRVAAYLQQPVVGHSPARRPEGCHTHCGGRAHHRPPGLAANGKWQQPCSNNSGIRFGHTHIQCTRTTMSYQPRHNVGCLRSFAVGHALFQSKAAVKVFPAAAVHLRTPPAATPAADPALLPQLPVLTLQGFLVVTSSNHWSPHASSPVAVLASSTPPARPDRALYAQEGCGQTRNTAEGQWGQSSLRQCTTPQ